MNQPNRSSEETKMKGLLSALAVLLFLPTTAEADCFGEGAYRVCSESNKDSRGNTHIRSYDTMGNT